MPRSVSSFVAENGDQEAELEATKQRFKQRNQEVIRSNISCTPILHWAYPVDATKIRKLEADLARLQQMLFMKEAQIADLELDKRDLTALVEKYRKNSLDKAKVSLTYAL